jgi:hypothetical protein
MKRRSAIEIREVDNSCLLCWLNTRHSIACVPSRSALGLNQNQCGRQTSLRIRGIFSNHNVLSLSNICPPWPGANVLCPNVMSHMAALV